MRPLIWLTVAVALVNLVAFGLTDLDEGFYASVAWEMHQRRDWLTPTFLGEPWFEKPPFLYWLMGLSQSIFGENLFAIRLPSVLMFALTLITLGYWGNRRLGEGVGTRSALLFAIAPLSFLLAHMAITDMTLTALLLIGLIALWELSARPLLWSVLGGIALGCAVLTKGPVGLVLLGLLYLWNLRLLTERGVRFRWVVVALGVALLTCLPWYIGVYLKHGGDFFNEFVVRQNLLRFAGGDTAHSVLTLMTAGGIGNFVAGLAVYLLFYGVVLALLGLPMVIGANVLWQRQDDPLRTYLRRWALLVFGLFTLSFTKLPAYIFPMFPALALLVADSLGRRPLPRWGFLLGLVSGAIWLLAGSLVGWMSGAYWAMALGVGYLLAIGWVFSPSPDRVSTSGSTPPYSPLPVNREGESTSSTPSSPLFSIRHPELSSVRHPERSEGSEIPRFARNDERGTLAERGAGGVRFSSALLPLGVLLFLIGFNGVLVGYDRIALSPVRELALSVPSYRTLVVYRVNPSYPSLQFYRKGQYAPSSDPEAVLQQMRSEGAYCLTTDRQFASNPAVLVVRQRAVLGRNFYLLAPRYDAPL